MQIVFIMDPVSTVIVDEDTTYALMREAEGRGHSVFHCLPRDVELDGRTLSACLSPATTTLRRDEPIVLGEKVTVDLARVDVVMVRKDPPFDRHYLWLTLLLEHLRGQTPVFNDPRGLRDANEKLYACFFPDVTPETTVSADRAAIRRFVDRVGGAAVIKPIDGHGGANVFALTDGDRNTNAMIDVVTSGGTLPAIVQRLIPEVTLGDKRILLLDGEPLGAILRVPQGGDLRSNIHVGAKVVKATLDDADRRIIAAVGPRLRQDGLVFVGLDVIGGLLTEVNVTSPTGIQQMARLDGENYAAAVIDRFEAS